MVCRLDNVWHEVFSSHETEIWLCTLHDKMLSKQMLNDGIDDDEISDDEYC